MLSVQGYRFSSFVHKQPYPGTHHRPSNLLSRPMVREYAAIRIRVHIVLLLHISDLLLLAPLTPHCCFLLIRYVLQNKHRAVNIYTPVLSENRFNIEVLNRNIFLYRYTISKKNAIFVKVKAKN